MRFLFLVSRIRCVRVWHHGPVITFVQTLVTLAGVYLALGILFAIPFVFRGVNRIDPVAGGSSWGFRLIIIPGVIVLWPLLARRWMTRRPPPVECNPHRRAAGGGA